MTAIMPAFPHLSQGQRTVTRSEAGTDVAYQRTLAGDRTITGGATVRATADEGATVAVTRTGPGGRTATVEKTFTAEQVTSFEDRLAQLRDRMPGTTPGPAADPTGEQPGCDHYA